MISSYESELARRNLDWKPGSGTETVTVPAGAWVTSFSFTGGLSGASLVMTDARGTVRETIELDAGESYSAPVYDMGKLGGSTWAFDSAGKFIVEWYL